MNQGVSLLKNLDIEKFLFNFFEAFKQLVALESLILKFLASFHYCLFWIFEGWSVNKTENTGKYGLPFNSVPKDLSTWTRGNCLTWGTSVTPGLTLPKSTVWRLLLFIWVFRCPEATSRGRLTVVQHHVTRALQNTGGALSHIARWENWYATGNFGQEWL